jgi:large subunit ribosomal protein L9
MKVILQRDIPKLGKHGDIVNVADGYARNYLFPRQYAVAAAGGALKEHAARMAREKERDSRNLQNAQSSAERLQNASLTLTGRVGSGTKLYGSITAQDVADAIAKEYNVSVDRRRIGLADPIKNLGRYDIPVRLHSDVTVHLAVEVVTEEELTRRKAEAASTVAPAAPAAAEEVPAPVEAALAPAEAAPASPSEEAAASLDAETAPAAAE